MKSITISFCSNTLFGQDASSQLFFSEYVEDGLITKPGNIDPTGNEIDLSAYSVSRYSNGGTTPSTTQLEGIINPYDVVLCLDKQDQRNGL